MMGFLVDSERVRVCLVHYRLQGMRDNNLMKDGDWMTKEAAAREGLPAHFTNEQIQAKMAEVRGRERFGGWG